ncbi:MAG: MraY family glycosyltransferase [Candidatus Cloacimonadales bacterium]|jgi:UDP-GlcNAc:undecaprenyl-phosphate GlcNAc-1-phosphate transferase|nr:undecaprenyl/decaprenyl-phosphate alpha-N-acetylglucosaminyl 1-phosphate transferase [Candidatus Cloacimonadota bacterium]MDD2649714.1 MraY family glycosyltransferase [Candidatus Cloacimonadota bacterium]MDD3500807.1 MraY family glycosyltransferase [Candidatus Cloacimonadota bacterium]MDX9977291.1 MraY family glycosyltransferase [Candidatus Cloacimonadales bacterium]
MILYPLIFSLFVLIISFFLVPINIKISNKVGLISIPNDRSVHAQNTPSAGGLSFAIPIIMSEIILLFMIQDEFFHKNMLGLIVGNILVLTLGIVDDKYCLNAKLKLLGQLLLAVSMFFLGFRIEQITNPFGASIPIYDFSFPLTLIWYLVIMNAMNLIDGLDGLAAGITIICCIVLAIAGFYYGNITVLVSSLLLASGCLSFLYYNYPPAKIFMGDSGSLFIGFQFASISILGTYQLKGLTTMTLLIPVTVLFVPLLDVLTSIYRRLKNKQNIFKADKMHIHHRMLKTGFSVKTVMLISWFVTLLFALLALGYILVNRQIMLVILLSLSILTGIFFYYLVKKEFFK